jgi:transcriptional regulator with XRE-family HTH domain
MNGKKKSNRKAVSLDEPQQFVEKISTKIRAMREATDLSQEKFAYQSGIDRTQWANMENGVDMRISSLYRALAALDISPAEFFKDFK